MTIARDSLSYPTAALIEAYGITDGNVKGALYVVSHAMYRHVRMKDWSVQTVHEVSRQQILGRDAQAFEVACQAAGISAMEARNLLTELEKNHRRILAHDRDSRRIQTVPLAVVPRPMSDEAKKPGVTRLVFFKRKGWRTVWWGSTTHHNPITPENGIWLVDDDKHGPYMLRGYSDGDDTHWAELPGNPNG